MKINVLTDLHLEFGQFTLHGGDVLLLCGDVCVAAYLNPNRTDQEAKRYVNRFKQFFHVECAKYKQVYYIMGNHEHYRGTFDTTAHILRGYLEGTNVTLLDKEFVDLGDWRLFGGTLWTDYNNGDWFACHAAKEKMNDHTIIKKMDGNNIRYFGPHDAIEEHKVTLAALTEKIDKPTIVMTHHAPTALSVHLRYAGDIINHAFYTELGDFILDHPNIKYWFHGHTHYNFDYEVGNCRVVCNPRGYHGYEVNNEFNTKFEVEI